VEIEVCLTSSSVSAGRLMQASLVEKVGKKKTTSLLEGLQCLTSDCSGVGNSEGESCVSGNTRDSVWVLGELRRGEK
jgi:hypothetical protein